MHLRQRSTQLILWIACLALAVGALLPSVTHSVRQAAPNGWFEVCTSFGAKWVRASEARTDSEGPEAPPRGIHEHCVEIRGHVVDGLLKFLEFLFRRLWGFIRPAKMPPGRNVRRAVLLGRLVPGRMRGNVEAE